MPFSKSLRTFSSSHQCYPLAVLCWDLKWRKRCQGLCMSLYSCCRSGDFEKVRWFTPVTGLSSLPIYANGICASGFPNVPWGNWSHKDQHQCDHNIHCLLQQICLSIHSRHLQYCCISWRITVSCHSVLFPYCIFTAHYRNDKIPWAITPNGRDDQFDF